MFAYTTEQLVQMAANGNRIGNPNKRGLNVYNRTQLMGASAIDKEGKIQNVTYELPYFGLTIDERIDIFRLCSPVFGIVTSRMNRISSLDWSVTPIYKNEDKLVDSFKYKKSIFDDFNKSDEIKYRIAAKMLARELLQELPELLPDLSNFGKSISRYSKMLRSNRIDISDEIYEWLQQPNHDTTFIDFIKSLVFDLMVHGSFGIYKEILNHRVENLYILPGGTVLPVRNTYVGGITAYLQTVDLSTPQIFFSDELCHSNYIPTSARSYGMVPLEALVNKIAESLLFDQLMAEQADGTKPPEKIVVFGDVSPFGDITGSDFNTPMDPKKQKRIENILNEYRKNAVKVLTGVGQPLVVDLTRENTMGTQMERQKLIREEVALVYNMSNLEINISNSEGVSGRATSDSLETIDQNKGVIPLVKILESKFNREIIPFRFGPGYMLEAQIFKDRDKELDYYKKKVDSGLYGVNEVRTNDLGEDPFDDPSFDKPKGAQIEQSNPLMSMMGMK